MVNRVVFVHSNAVNDVLKDSFTCKYVITDYIDERVIAQHVPARTASVGFMYHKVGTGLEFFNDPEQLSTDIDYKIETISAPGPRVASVFNKLRSLRVTTVDMITCTLEIPDAVLRSYYTSYRITVRYSINQTGYPGDWIMESHDVDIRSLYFNDKIKDYNKSLGTWTDPATGLQYMGAGYSPNVCWLVGPASSSATTINIPSSVTFDNGDGYGEMSWSVVRVHRYILRECRSATSITLPSTLTYIDSHSFTYADSLAGSLIIPDGVTYIGESVFHYIPYVTYLKVPNSVTALGANSFYYTGSLNNADFLINTNITYLGQPHDIFPKRLSVTPSNNPGLIQVYDSTALTAFSSYITGAGFTAAIYSAPVFENDLSSAIGSANNITAFKNSLGVMRTNFAEYSNKTSSTFFPSDIITSITNRSSRLTPSVPVSVFLPSEYSNSKRVYELSGTVPDTVYIPGDDSETIIIKRDGNSSEVTINSSSITYNGTNYGIDDTVTIHGIDFIVIAIASVMLQQTTSDPCVTVGTNVLTPGGYKPIESLSKYSLFVTADKRVVPGKIVKTHVENYPILSVKANSIRRNMPFKDVEITRKHAIALGGNNWTYPSNTPGVSIKHYTGYLYNIITPDYAKDTIIFDGLVCETFGIGQKKLIYHPVDRTRGIYKRFDKEEYMKALVDHLTHLKNTRQ